MKNLFSPKVEDCHDLMGFSFTDFLLYSLASKPFLYLFRALNRLVGFLWFQNNK